MLEARRYTSIPKEHDADGWLRSQGFSSQVTGARLPGLVIPLWGVDGRRWGWQYKPDRPRKDGKGKVRKYEQPVGQDTRLDVNPLMVDELRDRTRPVWVTEGAKKVDAAASSDLVCVGLAGVSAWRTPDWNELKLPGRRVFIAFDSDAVTNPAVATQERKLALFLRSMGADARIVRIPPTPDGGKQGLDDYLAAGGAVADLVAGAAELELPQDRPDDRPALNVTNAADLADRLRAELGTGPTAWVFNRGGQLVQVPRIGEDGYLPLTEDVDDAGRRDDDGPAQVRELRPGGLAARLDSLFWCYAATGDGWVHRLAPRDVASRLVDSADDLPSVRRLTGVVHVPVLRPDWTVLADPGYDPTTRLLYLPDPAVERVQVPDRPSPAELTAARDLLLHVVEDFPFTSDDDRANFLAAMMAPILHRAVGGTLPLLVINAPMTGSGKTLLSTVLRTIHGGVHRTRMPDGDDEVRKQITSILSTTTGTVVVFDNVTGTLRAGDLANLLTATTWSDRPLGSTATVTAVNDRLWCVSGNNIALGGDLARRGLWVTIDADSAQPWERSGFAIPKLVEYVTEHWAELLSALHTLIRAWAVQDRPQTESRSDSFAGFAHATQGVLDVAGIPGQVMSEASNKAAIGADDVEWAALLDSLLDQFDAGTFSAKAVSDLVVHEWPRGPRSRALFEALPDTLSDKARRGHGIVKSLAAWFRHREGRYAGGVAVRACGKDRNGVLRYKIVTSGAGSAGSAGVSRGQ